MEVFELLGKGIISYETLKLIFKNIICFLNCSRIIQRFMTSDFWGPLNCFTYNLVDQGSDPGHITVET